jgi:uncharacterized protein YbjT (DUF2867 family)/uncharacterized membrane protein YphA (DoxX/SURF4 family)
LGTKLRVFLAGAEGFLGRHIAVALLSAEHEVIAGVRRPLSLHAIACDFNVDLEPAAWIPRLVGIDVVINAVGILRETSEHDFERVHVEGPKALFEACVMAGVRRVIQISALGDPAVGEYLASKHRGDVELTKLDLDWTIIRPSLVYSVAGSYGGTSLLRAMAALPGVLVVPGAGDQLIQPLLAEDLALAIVALIERGFGIREVVLAVGPGKVTLLDYLQVVRRWLEVPAPVVVRVPSGLATCGAWVGEYLGNGPLGLTMWRMLMRGNVAPSGSDSDLATVSAVPLKSLEQAFGGVPSFVQDRWHARLYFLGPVLRVALALLWIGSGLVGFLNPLEQSYTLFSSAGLPVGPVRPLVWAASAVDLVLGVLALIAWRPTIVAALMCASVVVYTVFVGVVFPSLWLEPFGGLLKNLPLIPTTLIMSVLSRRR